MTFTHSQLAELLKEAKATVKFYEKRGPLYEQCTLAAKQHVVDLQNDLVKIRRIRTNNNRKAKDQAMRDCGLIKVRGALGGIYWE